MSVNQETPLARRRRRLQEKGVVRLELRVRKEDAALLRGLAVALQNLLAEDRPVRLKALLAAGAPDDLDLSRPRDLGRNVEL